MTGNGSADPRVRLRSALAMTEGRMIVVPRAAVEALLQADGPGGSGEGVFLTGSERDVEALARAAWETATDPSYVDRFGAWGSNHTEHVRHQMDAARRTIAQLIAWARTGGPPDTPANHPAP